MYWTDVQALSLRTHLEGGLRPGGDLPASWLTKKAVVGAASSDGDGDGEFGYDGWYDTAIYGNQDWECGVPGVFIGRRFFGQTPRFSRIRIFFIHTFRMFGHFLSKNILCKKE